MNRIVATLQSPEGLRAGLAAAGPSLVTLVAVILIAAQLAALLWRVLAAGGTTAGSAAITPPAPAPRIDLAAVVNAHLFGIANLSDAGSALSTVTNLVLAGTLAGLAPEHGWAIIGPTPQQAHVYETGASVPGGARLVAVFPNRVVLERGGVREQLMLPRLAGGTGTAPAVSYAPGGPAGQRSLADSVSELVNQNPNAANELLRPQPVFAGGQLRGYRVYPGRNRAQFLRIGLQPGDLVLSVNGVALDDPNRGLEILRSVGQGDAVTLSIDRNGQQQTLSVDASNVVEELQPAEEPQTSQEVDE